ncbi:MAG: hypothetical protein K5920_09080 [Bacteroidales bacterium]|nr:hypothetical protein [Bacteroidales bacterium]
MNWQVIGLDKQLPDTIKKASRFDRVFDRNHHLLICRNRILDVEHRILVKSNKPPKQFLMDLTSPGEITEELKALHMTFLVL